MPGNFWAGLEKLPLARKHGFSKNKTNFLIFIGIFTKLDKECNFFRMLGFMMPRITI